MSNRALNTSQVYGISHCLALRIDLIGVSVVSWVLKYVKMLRFFKKNELLLHFKIVR